jgi:hypothetical protein
MMIHEITALAGKYKSRKRVGRGPGSGVGKRSAEARRARARAPATAAASSSRAARCHTSGACPSSASPTPTSASTSGSSTSARSSSTPTSSVGRRRQPGNPHQGRPRPRRQPRHQDPGRPPRGRRQDRRQAQHLGQPRHRPGPQARRGRRRQRDRDRHPPDRVRGVDRNSDDRSPKNQTKKAKRRDFQEKKADAAARARPSRRSNRGITAPDRSLGDHRPRPTSEDPFPCPSRNTPRGSKRPNPGHRVTSVKADRDPRGPGQSPARGTR